MNRLLSILLLLPSLGIAATGDLTFSVREDGESVDVFVTGHSSNSMFFNGFTNHATATYTNYNLLSHSNGLRFRVTSPGYVGGVATTVDWDIYGTKLMRLPYPSDTTNHVIVSGGVANYRVALSKSITTQDVLVAYTTTNAFRDTNAGVGCAAISGQAVTNRGVMGYGLAVARRTPATLDEIRITNTTTTVSIVGFSGMAFDGQPLDSVDVIVRDENNHWVTNRITEMTVDRASGDMLPSGQFTTIIQLTNMTAQDRLRFDFIARKRVGNSNAVLNTLTDTYASPLPSSWTNLYDPNNVLVPFKAVVALNGSDVGGKGTNATPEATGSADYFASIAKATLAVYNSNSYAGGIVYVRGGVSNYTGSSQTFTSTPKSRVIILPYPGESVVLTNQTGGQDLADRVEMRNITLGGAAEFFFNCEKLALIDCVISNSATRLWQSCKEVVVLRGQAPKVAQGFRSLAAENTSFFKQGINLDGFDNILVVSPITMGCVHPNLNGANYTVVSDSSGQLASHELGICYNNYFGGFAAPSSSVVNFGQNLPVGLGFAAVQNVFEIATNASLTVFNFFSNDHGYTNIINAYNLFTGQRMFYGYNDVHAAIRRQYHGKNTIIKNSGLKTDNNIGPFGGERTNNWGLMNGVDHAGMFWVEANDVAGEAAGNFNPEFIGLLSYHPPGSATNDTGYPQYIDPRTAGSGNPTGGGNYRLKRTSPVQYLGDTNLGGEWGLSFDLEALPRTAANNMPGPYAGVGALYYVSTNGNDSTNGSITFPWRTLQKAYNVMTNGDTAYAFAGDYNEYVTTASHGDSATSTNRITLKAYTTPVVTRQIRVNHRYHWIEGISVTKSIDTDPLNQNNAHIRVEPGATGTVITNNLIADTPMISARFHMTTNLLEFLLTVTNSTGNFHTNGFVAGGLIFLGANSANYYTNHDRAARIKAISADGQTLTVTNSAGTNWLTEPAQGKWATIYAGQGSSAYQGIYLPLGSGVHAATNCVIRGNIISNLSGAAFIAYGENYHFAGNRITRLHGYYAIRPFGRHPIIEDNLWIDSTNRIWFTDQEFSEITHPGDSSFFDYNIGAIHSQVANTTNITFRRNWLQNFEQQIGAIDKKSITGSGRFLIESNVIVGFQSQFSQNADWITNRNNTYFRAGYESGHALSVGGISATERQTNIEVSATAFIDCGESKTATTGWYESSNTEGSNFVNNFVTGPEGMSWPAKTSVATAPIAVNGGDPVMVNALNPLGPDGLPFTADDGLRPLPNSPLAKNGIGALTPVVVTAGQPISHFAVASQTTWLDYIYTNFNTAWVALEQPDRGGPVRPYTTPNPIGNVPALVKFTGTNSIGGLDSASTNNVGITNYVWNFGDGSSTKSTTNGEAWYTFGSTGTVLVTLTVYNSLGNSSSSSNLFRVLGATNFAGGGVAGVHYVATNGNDTTGTGRQDAPYRTMAKAETVVAASNVVAVLQGQYDEVVDINRNVATTTGRITYIGYGARSGGFNVRHPNYTFDGFELTGEGLLNFGKVFYLYEAADNTWIFDNHIHDVTNIMGVGMAAPASTLPWLGQLNCIISNNFMDRVLYINIELHGSNHLVIDNVTINTGRIGGEDGDALRIFGSNHRISRHLGTNIWGGHGDCFQTFGDQGYWCKDMILEDSLFIGTTNGSGTAICQLEMDANINYLYTNELQMTNFHIRNCQFINMFLAGSVDIAGTKWYNCLFYRATVANPDYNGEVLNFGGESGSSYGTEIKNTIFYKCEGWYPRTNEQAGVTYNWSLTANNNYVSDTNGAAWLEAPPDGSTRFKSDGQDANGINGGDPRFVNEAALNFHLQASSPLLNAGMTISGFSADMEGTARPQGAAWDVGPYEGSQAVGGGSSSVPMSISGAKLTGVRIGL